MMRLFSLSALLALVASVLAAAPAPPEGPKEVRLAPQANVKQERAFRYRLLPGPDDRLPGNAAPLWHLAVDTYRDAPRKMTVAEHDVFLKAPLSDLPRKEMHDVLDRSANVLRLARQAACRTRCDWDLPPLTIQSLPDSLHLSLIQTLREFVVVLTMQYRLQLVEGRFREAAETLQTGFALARHLCEGDIVLHNLVGVAIANIVLYQVEEWIQTPGSPNLYWALTELPRPLGNLRHAIEYELGTYSRSFPALRRVRRETLTARQAEDVVQEMFSTMSKMLADTPKQAEAARKLGESIRAAEQYPQARRYLLDGGRTAKELDALPRVQVVLLWHLERYDRAADAFLKGLIVPPWQAKPLLEAAQRDVKENGETNTLLIELMMAAIVKTWEANVRVERTIAGLRCAEALRGYAAFHEGKSPEKWTDLTAVPLPLDPYTGKGFEAFYQSNDGRGVLEIPPPPGMPALLGRRYDLVPSR